jgi:hypothetical protein
LVDTLWERGYFVSTVGVNEQAVRRYVENQHLHHSEFKQQCLFKKIILVITFDNRAPMTRREDEEALPLRCEEGSKKEPHYYPYPHKGGVLKTQLKKATFPPILGETMKK